jgi:hypothetical protein
MSIFSIDVEAHLKKAASHTFGSAAHYPVELVRAALRRGGREVDILIGRDRIQVQDNGPGMDTASINTLIRLMDPTQPEAVKEEAVESLQTREGMGLLAIFASDPEEILVENVSHGKKTHLHFRGNQLKTPGSCSLTKGTRITLFSSRRDYTQEKHILAAFCRSVPRRTRLKLNNRPIGGQSFLIHQMATMKLSPSTLAHTYTAGGRVGIPLAGMICHLRLLDQFIPWHHLTLPPQQGFIFDAAVETTDDVTHELIDYLCQHAHRLYQWMCQRYTSAVPDHRYRFEELLFTHCRLTGDEAYLNQFSPFKIFNSRRSLNLQQVKQKAADGSLYAVPQKKKKDRLRYNTASKTVLSLPRAQADLLINQLNIPITFLNPVTRRQNPLPKLWYTVRKKIKRLICYILPKPQKILTTEQLSKSEQKFLAAFIRGLTRSGESMPYQIQSPDAQAVMVQGKGLFPSILTKTKDKSSLSSQRLLIRRSHPLVRKAIKAVEADPRNIEIFVPLLIF